MCLENDKQRNESLLHFARNERNQETRGNYNEKFEIKKLKFIRNFA